MRLSVLAALMLVLGGPLAMAQTPITAAQANAALGLAREQVQSGNTRTALRTLMSLAPFYAQLAQAAKTDGRADPLHLQMASDLLRRARRQLQEDDPASASSTMLEGLEQLRAAVPAGYGIVGAPTLLHQD